MGISFLGRVVSGMKIMTTELAVSLPYFDTTMLSNDVEEKKELDEKLMSW